MVEIGGRPILWHILKIYSQHGINDFVICCGYKGYLIKEYFANYFLHMSDVTFDLRENHMQVHQSVAEPWHITLVDTGDNAGTGGRLRKVAAYVEGERDFCMTYGDGVSDLNISASIDFHRSHGKLVTVTAVQPTARFGGLSFVGTTISAFREKPEGEGGWINGGFFVLSPEVMSEIPDESSMFEQELMQKLSARNQVQAFFHHGFWQPMDTLRDKQRLEELWTSGRAPWKTW
jgi:glucose-1-phosphate cytidylyltransferase